MIDPAPIRAGSIIFLANISSSQYTLYIVVKSVFGISSEWERPGWKIIKSGHFLPGIVQRKFWGL